MAELTRKEFYALAEYCHTYALELARHEQDRVNLDHCYQFNRWLPKVKSYDLLAAKLASVRLARPINRTRLMVVVVAVMLLAALFLAPSIGRSGLRILSIVHVTALIVLLLVPERHYGTTIQLLEGRVLRVVDSLEELLMSGQMGFSEAAFFQVKQNLERARQELRQQIHLADRW